MKRVLAFDFGASSGRAIIGIYDSDAVEPFSYHEIHRFENNPITVDGTLCWDFDSLMTEVRRGIQLAGEFDSIGFDTWGVDFGLIDVDGNLLGLPVHYRDTRTDAAIQSALQQMSPETLYRHTGNQIMAINTLFQLVALQQSDPQLLKKADKLLFMPDLFAYQCCGQAVCETSIASTSQMLNPSSKQWSDKVLQTFDIDPTLFGTAVQSGSVIGKMGDAAVISVAGHDTQCAVTAMPTNQTDVAFLSCGTWSLLGTELDLPILTEQSQQAALSNELGANGKVNYLKNIIGLWLIQESRRAWRKKGEEYSFNQLEHLALDTEPFACFIDPDAPEFGVPGDLPTRVQEFCAKTGQYVPQTVGEIVRCIYESLALKYQYALKQLGTVTGKTFTALHILGGGTKDGLLCQMSANSTGLPVLAGPIEATAIGNMLIQLVALGALSDLQAGRELVAQTQSIKRYDPVDVSAWAQAFERYQIILEKE